MLKKPSDYNNIPKEIKDQFLHENVRFVTSKFEEYMLNDIYMNDESSKVKLNRDVTKDFISEMEMYKKEKRNIRYTIKGETRDGKSYTGLAIGDHIVEGTHRDYKEDIELIVCGNQVEYREKLKNAVFGDFYLVDENFFTRAGLGANIESQQLTDYNNIIAKQNISVIFITPEKFLNVGATLGFSTYGRDSRNWLSRCLLYKMKGGMPFLIGYVVFDIGKLFRKHNCYLYKTLGGCTNTKKKELKDIDKNLVKHSSCIPQNYSKEDLAQDTTTCPFYHICKHPMARYEKKKDSWIEKEMEGGLDERTKERYILAIKLIMDMVTEVDPQNGTIKLKARNAKDLKNRVRIKVPAHTNTKMGIGEFEELVEIVKSNTDLEMLQDSLKQVQDTKLTEQIQNHEILGEFMDLTEDEQKEEESKPSSK